MFKLVKTYFILVQLLVGAVSAEVLVARADSLPRNSPSKPKQIQKESWFEWSLNHLLQPTIATILWPLYPPLVYLDEYEVIDRGIDLASWGPKNKIMTFPVLYPFGQNDSYVGLRNIINGTSKDYYSRYTQYLKYSVGGDYAFSLDFSLGLGGFVGKTEFSKNSYLAKLVYMPEIYGLDTLTYMKHADSSFFVRNDLNISLSPLWSLNLGMDFEFFKYDSPDVLKKIDSQSVQNLSYRGFYSDYFSIPLSVGLSRDTRESDFTSTVGSKFSTNIKYGLVKGYGNYINHDVSFHIYKLLGEKKYKISKEEDRIRMRNLMRFKVDEAIPFLDMSDWKNSLLNRRVLVSSLRYSQLWDTQEQPAVFSSLNQLGTSTPLRAYGSGRFLSYGNFAFGNEYRWPIIRRVDGVFFNEYAVYYNNPIKFEQWQMRNSWGFGLRVANPDFYFIRMQLAFHGFNGVGILLTTSPEIN